MAEDQSSSRQSQQQQYTIKEAIIYADRYGGLSEEAYTFDVSRLLQELTLYESLNKPYVTGQLLLVDDTGLFDAMSFKGTERFDITLLSVNATEDISFPKKGRKTFIITNVEKMVKTGDRTTVYMFNIIEQHAFKNANIRISKAYKGKIEDIITSILTSELKVDVDLSYSINSFQQPIKVTIPYMTPLHACDWLKKRITSVNGSPFFLYSSIHDENVRLGNLDTMLRQKAFNKLPYRYSRATTQSTADETELSRAFVVHNATFENMENTLQLVKNGAIGSLISSTDLSKGNTVTAKYKARDTLANLRASGVININAQQNVFDPLHVIIPNEETPKYTDDMNSIIFHELSSPKTYLEYNNYHDYFGPAELRKKIENFSINQLLLRNMIDFEVPGTAFIIGSVSVGDITRVDFLNSNVNSNATSTEDMLDKNRSGDYLIYAVRHTFRDTVHNVTMSITKLSEKPKPIDGVTTL